MRLQAFGCDGGIGDPLRTLALLVDDDLVVEAGSGLGDLSLGALGRIDHVLVSHSHLDHVACLPLLIDAVSHSRLDPVTVHAMPETIEALRAHVFNWTIWPDSTRLPSPERPLLRFAPLERGRSLELGGRKIEPLPAQHAVPTVGFLLDSGRASLAYTADTTTCDALWEALDRVENLAYLIVETSYTDRERALTARAGHLCPALLGNELRRLRRPAEVFIAHTKPGLGDTIMREIEALGLPRRVRRLARGQILEF